jgi:hypothetical protein
MNRAELRALVSELQERNPEVRVELQRLLTPRGAMRDGRYFQVNVTLQVVESFYIDQGIMTTANVVGQQMTAEIQTLRESCSQGTRDRLRHERLVREAPESSVARQLLQASPRLRPYLWSPTPESPPPSLLQTPPRPMNQVPVPFPDSFRRALSIQVPTMPAPAAPKIKVGEAVTQPRPSLWDLLESDDSSDDGAAATKAK